MQIHSVGIDFGKVTFHLGARGAAGAKDPFSAGLAQPLLVKWRCFANNRIVSVYRQSMRNRADRGTMS